MPVLQTDGRHGYHDELVIPVIDNTAKEEDLASSLADAITRSVRGGSRRFRLSRKNVGGVKGRREINRGSGME